MILFSFCELPWIIPWLIPFLLGIIVGWGIWARYKNQVAGLEEEKAGLLNEKSDLEAALGDCKSQRAALDSELILLKQIMKEKEAELEKKQKKKS